jgi:hypothetical protein
VAASTKLTKTGTALGTPLYMAPEQIRGSDVSDRTDVYALGAILFEMIAGRPPFDGSTALAVLGRILLEPAPPLRAYVEDVPAAVEEVVRACLAKDPKERPPAQAVVAILRAAGIEVDRTLVPLEDTVAVSSPAAAAIVVEQRASAVLVIRDAPRGEVKRFEATPGSSWDTLRDGTVFGLFVDARSPDTASLRAARVALAIERAAAAARIVVCAGRVADDTRSFVGEIFQRAAGIDPPAPGTWADSMTAEVLARRFRFEESAGGLVRVREPDADRDRSKAPTVGRGAEQAQLEAVIRSAMEDGRPRAALVVGPPGRGKSRLCRDVRAAAAAITGVDPMLVAFDPLSVDSPWSALGLGVARFRARGSASVALGALEDAALRRVAREEQAGDDDSLRAVAKDGDAWRDLLRASIEGLVQSAAGSSAVALLVEDMQWADAATVRLFDDLAASEDLPLAIIAFARPEIDARFPSVWARRNVLRIDLAPIGRRASERLVRAIAPAIGAADLERIVALAAGGPLVLEELARYWVKNGHVASTSSAKQVFEAELAQLETDERLVLRAASLVGDVFWSECVAEMLRDVPVDVRAMLDRFEQGELVARQTSRLAGHEEMRVRHALLREAAVDAIGDDARRRLHASAAAWLDRAGAEHVLLAHHAEHGCAISRRAPTKPRRARRRTTSRPRARSMLARSRSCRKARASAIARDCSSRSRTRIARSATNASGRGVSRSSRRSWVHRGRIRCASRCGARGARWTERRRGRR